MFEFWSKINPDARKELKPDFGVRSWSDLKENDKYVIWKHLEKHFFDKDIKEKRDFMGNFESKYYKFYGEVYEQEKKKERVWLAIDGINGEYKANNYTPNYLENKTLNAACFDFYKLFSSGSENIVFELISFFAFAIQYERKDKTIAKGGKETEAEYSERLEKWRWGDFDDFKDSVNDVFQHFGLDFRLTRLGFVTTQERKIEEEIYEPVLKKLSNTKWKDVNRDLSDAFEDYRQNDYSGAITHTISAVQAFLQILFYGKTGKGDISDLLKDLKKRSSIPDDDFSSIFFDQINSYIARTRQEKGDPHPKKEYATEKNARLVLNLAMVMFEHCIK